MHLSAEQAVPRSSQSRGRWMITLQWRQSDTGRLPLWQLTVTSQTRQLNKHLRESTPNCLGVVFTKRLNDLTEHKACVRRSKMQPTVDKICYHFAACTVYSNTSRSLPYTPSLKKFETYSIHSPYQLVTIRYPHFLQPTRRKYSIEFSNMKHILSYFCVYYIHLYFSISVATEEKKNIKK